MTKDYEKYCPDVWKTMYVSKLDQQRVAVGFCCLNTTDIVTETGWENTLEQKRQDFVQSAQPSQCKNCWQVESSGGTSRRTQSIIWFQNNDIVQDQQPQLISLEWNCENLCNLACITCGPVYSSRWASEIKKYSWSDSNQYYAADQNKFYETLDLSNLRRVYFNGGEPLLTSDHIKILSRLQQEGVLNQCEIAYNTNGTILPDDSCLSLWKQSKLVRIMLSIDAVGDSFEFIRWPAKWAQMLKFIEVLNSQSFNVVIDITCTVGIHNVFSMDELYRWYVDNCSVNHQGDRVSLNIQSCGAISHGGRVLNLKNISSSLANRVIDYLNTMPPVINVDPLINLCRSANANDQDWIFYLDSLSSARQTDWKKYLPHLNDQYNKLS